MKHKILLNEFILEMMRPTLIPEGTSNPFEKWRDHTNKIHQTEHDAQMAYLQKHHNPRVERAEAIEAFMATNKDLRAIAVASDPNNRLANTHAWLAHTTNIPPIISDKASPIYTIHP